MNSPVILLLVNVALKVVSQIAGWLQFSTIGLLAGVQRDIVSLLTAGGFPEMGVFARNVGPDRRRTARIS